jgi:predicted lipoprotein with Yx(FWY)xxD motif
VTSDGWTVYRCEADTPEPPISLCENDCLRAWPPLLTDGTPPQLDGIDPALVGTLDRPDGTVQMTLGGWPLYRFVDDTAPGDTLGEDVGGNWSAVAADGKALVAK